MSKKAYIGVDNVARQIKKMYIGVSNFPPRNLPDGYTQVEYIQSASAYIDTGFKPNQNTKVVMDVQLVSETASHQAFFGAMTSSTEKAFGAMWHDITTTNHHLYFGAGSTSLDYFDAYARHLITVNKNVMTVDSLSVSRTYVTFQTDYNMYLLCMNNAGTASYPARAKLYSCKIYDNGKLIRDFVPCINSSAVAGLYDVANNVFYTNQTATVFSTGAAYMSVARRIKKAYIGIGGVARPFWDGAELSYYGTITSLSQARDSLHAASVGNYALFAGGINGNTIQKTVDAYNKSLTRSIPSELTTGSNAGGAATSTDKYAWFSAGYAAYMMCYNASLTRSHFTWYTLDGCAAASIGGYAIFGGGSNVAGTTVYGSVYAYDESFTQTQLDSLYTARENLAAASTSKYAFFAGGINVDDEYKSTVVAYNASLTRSYLSTGLSKARAQLAGAGTELYAFFAGGYYGSFSNVVDAFDNSLTRTVLPTLSGTKRHLAATSLGDFVLFGGGGLNSTVRETVDAYDSTLTRTAMTNLSVARQELAATTVGNYAIFAGGCTDITNGTQSAVAEAFTLM